MPSSLPTALSCCCGDEDGATTLVPGAAGQDGEDGADGSDGSNAFTTLAVGFTMPDVGEEVDASVVDGEFVNIGQYLHIANGGYFVVNAKADSTTITLENLGSSGNASPGDTVPTGSQVSPGGMPGATGSTGATGSNGIEYTTNRTSLKALASSSTRALVFLLEPEVGVAKVYRSIYGNSTTADDISVIEPTDGLCRYFQHTFP